MALALWNRVNKLCGGVDCIKPNSDSVWGCAGVHHLWIYVASSSSLVLEVTLSGLLL